MNRQVAARSAMAFALLAFFGWSATAQSQHAQLRLGYDVLYSGMTIATLDIHTSIGASAYQVDTRVTTTGLFNAIFPMMTQAHSEGRMVAGRPMPTLHRSETRGRSSTRTVEADFVDGRLVRFERRIVPPDPPMESRVSDAERRETTDPASAILSVVLAVTAGRGCATELATFDGRRIHQIRFADAGVQRPPSSIPVSFTDRAVVCTFAYESRDGVEPPTPTRTGRAWIGRVRPDGTMAPLRVELETRWGVAAVQLRVPAEPAAAIAPMP